MNLPFRFCYVTITQKVSCDQHKTENGEGTTSGLPHESAVSPGKTFDLNAFSPEVQQAIKDGIADAWKELDEFKKTKIDTGDVSSGELFGTREFLKNNYLYRMTAAVLGIYGNSEHEAIYPSYTVDANGDTLDGITRYTLRFAPGESRPAHAFMSLTTYKLPESLLVENVE